MNPIDMYKYALLKDMCENDGIHKVLGALINIYGEKANNDNEIEDYAYVRNQLGIAGANIYNNTYEPCEPCPETH